MRKTATSQEEREDTTEIHASAKEEKQMTEGCMKRNKNKEIIETGWKQEYGKRKQLDFFQTVHGHITEITF